MRRSIFTWPALARPANAIFYALLSAKALREKIGESMDRAQAIADLAQKDNRELTAEEKAEIDAILGTGVKGTANYKPGSIDTLERDLERAEKLEARQAELTATRTGAPFQAAGGPRQPQDLPGDDTPRVARVRIPAAARFRYGRLKAFTGVDAERTAYLAGQFYAATLFRNPNAMRWCKDHGIVTEFQANLGEGGDSAGGFLVPLEIEQTIIDLREQYGVFRRQANVVPMSGDTKDQPIRKSGPTAYWSGENAEVISSDKVWDRLRHVARKLAALTRYSNELAEDAIITIGDDLTREFAWCFSLKEDDAGFNGDGTVTYGGHVGLANALKAGSLVAAAAGNVSFKTLDLEDFESAAGATANYPGMDEAWYISKPGYWNSMRRLEYTAGGVLATEIAEGVRIPVFMGYPVIFTNVMPKALTTLANTILCYFGDLRMAAQLGNRRGLAIVISDQRYFEFDQLAIRGTERVSIIVHSTGTDTTPGAIVGLKTPAQ